MTSVLTNLAARLPNCRGILVDSNVLLDVATDDASCGDWSGRALAERADQTTLIITPLTTPKCRSALRPSKAWMPHRRLHPTHEKHCLGRQGSWPASVSWPIVGAAVSGILLCQTFTSVRMLLFEQLALLTRDVARLPDLFSQSRNPGASVGSSTEAATLVSSQNGVTGTQCADRGLGCELIRSTVQSHKRRGYRS